MAHTISGQIVAIDEKPTVITNTKSGNPFYKREFAIKALRYNPDDGTPELNEYNTPVLEVQGQENCIGLDTFKVGDFVKVKFILEGRSVVNQDGKTKYYNTARAISVEQISVKLHAKEDELPF